MSRLGRALLVALGFAVAPLGCGLKGPLYLPEKSKEVVVRPASAATSTPAAGTGTAAKVPATSEVPEEGPATQREIPVDTGTAPPPPPDTPTPAPPGSARG